MSLQAHLHIRRVAAQHLQCPLSTWTRRLSLAANRRAPFPPNLGYQSALLQLVTGERMGRPTESSSLSESLFHHNSALQDMFSTICLYFLSGSLWLNAYKASSLHPTLSPQSIILLSSLSSLLLSLVTWNLSVFVCFLFFPVILLLRFVSYCTSSVRPPLGIKPKFFSLRSLRFVLCW